MRRILPFFMVLMFAFTTANAQEATYVGDDTQCTGCHGVADASGAGYDIGAAFAENGHQYKLNEIVGGVAPTYPHDAITGGLGDITLPVGLDSWDNVSYVIGGFGWKSRFIKQDGFIFTGTEDNPLVQYNYQDKSWAAYHTGEDKAYNCGICHTTGWVDQTELENYQPNPTTGEPMPGMPGSFSQPGVHCEGCHGPGSLHVASPSADNISNVENCSDCHWRSPDLENVNTSGGFIKHHEQGEEMLNSVHSELACGDCHNPHYSTKFEKGGFLGQEATCETCHATDIKFQKHSVAATCINCHMPKATKSAIKINNYEGDIKSHIFKLNATEATKDFMFTEDGGNLAEDADGNAYITLDFACYGCHTDADGNGGGIYAEGLTGTYDSGIPAKSSKTMADLAIMAAGMHSTETSVSSFQTDDAMPNDYNLGQNYPNPFNPTTTIQYSVPNASDVTISVYSITGALVRTIESQYRNAGNYIVVWDGRNEMGSRLSSGVYIYTIQAGSYRASKRMTMIK